MILQLNYKYNIKIIWGGTVKPLYKKGDIILLKSFGIFNVSNCKNIFNIYNGKYEIVYDLLDVNNDEVMESINKSTIDDFLREVLRKAK